MKPYLLLNLVGRQETPIEKAKRRADALRVQQKQFRYEEMLKEELQSMQCIRELMREQPAPRSKWRRAIAAR